MTLVYAGISVGNYRKEFLELVKSKTRNLKVITGDVHFEPSYKAGQELGILVSRVKNFFYLQKNFIWQKNVLKFCISADACVIEHNPRSLTAWAVALGRRAIGKCTVAWGHVESRGGHKAGIGFLRHLQRLLCGVALYYTKEELKAAVKRYGNKPVAFIAPNALYCRSSWSTPPHVVPRDFIFIGRLSQDKKPEIALRAFLSARLSPDSEFHFVGDGPMRTSLELAAQTSSRKVNFHGSVNDRNVLAGLFQRSIAAVSPGYVGLSIVQSTFFGCPMIYARGEPHAPEIVLAKEGFNSISVDQCDHESFSKAMESAEQLFGQHTRRIEIALQSVADFNVEAMADGFIAAANYSQNQKAGTK